MNEGERGDDDDHEEAANQSFINLAGEDGEVDAFELKNILDSVFKRGRPSAVADRRAGRRWGLLQRQLPPLPNFMKLEVGLGLFRRV